MNESLYEKIDHHLTKIIQLLDQSDELKQIEQWKEKIVNDATIKQKINKLKELEKNPYDTDYQKLRKELFEEEKIKNYKKLENDLYYFTLELSKELKELIPERGHCQ